MKRKIIFISSLAVSLFLVGAVALTLFPNAKNLLVKKSVPVEIAKTDAVESVADSQAPGQNSDQPQTTQSAQSETQVVNTPAVSHPSSQTSTSPTDTSATTQTAGGKIVPNLVSWGFQKSSGRTIEAVIIHSSYDANGNDPFSVAGVIAEWKAAGVSPHYAIDRSGTIYQLVADQDIAYHAGVSTLPDGKTDVNGVSIGIEMINTQTAQFTSAQYSSLNYLISVLKGKYPIKYILGHDQISPGRKTDPWNIDWSNVQK